MELKLLSVNVGRPRKIGTRAGRPVRSAIGKIPIAAERIEVRALGLDGDKQADLRVHGGVDKAVYAYPADNWPWWEQEKQFPCRVGGFGENLTLSGGDETQMRIGDRFSWGQVILEISQPRSPCSKFQLYSGRDDASALMTLSGRCGWYLRVIEEGVAPARDTALTRVFASDGPTVRETFFAMHDGRTAVEVRRRIGETPALSKAWRKQFV